MLRRSGRGPYYMAFEPFTTAYASNYEQQQYEEEQYSFRPRNIHINLQQIKRPYYMKSPHNNNMKNLQKEHGHI